MRIRLEHDEIVRAMTLYIKRTYGEDAISTIDVKKIESKTGAYDQPPSYTLEADITMPAE